MSSQAPPSKLDVSKVASHWQDFLRRALSTWKSTTFSVRGTLGGQSGAAVMLVEIRTPEHDGLGILKLSDTDPANNEVSRQKQARTLAPALLARIPLIPHYFVEDARSAILMTVAGGGLLEAQVMATTSGGLLNLAVQRVSTSLYSEWNPEPNFDGKPVAADVLLREWLDHRLGPAGRIPDVLRQVLHISPDCQAFRYDGKDYPNPYGFAHTDFIGNQIDVSAGRGLVHGDLHSGNVLTSGPRQIDNYYFIDFSHFKSQAPLFFDHAYLELSLLLDARESLTHQRWHRLCQSLAHLEQTREASAAADTDDHGLLWTVGIIRAETGKWVERAYPQRKEDLKKQILLSRIAVGLNFANKRRLAADSSLSNRKKFFALLYAAIATKKLLDYCQVSIPTDGPVANPEGEVPQPSGNEWREVLKACANFDARHATYVLIVGPEAGKLPEHARRILGRLPWTLVIDFDPAGPNGALLQDAKPVLQRNRSLREVFPHQTAAAGCDSGVCWLFADSYPSGTGTEAASPAKWRQHTLPSLRALASVLHRETTPRPAHLVVLGRSIHPTQLRNTYTALEEVLGEAFDAVVICSDESDETHAALVQETTAVRKVICDWCDLALGLHQMLGEASEASSIWIPVRDSTSKVVRHEPVDPEHVGLYSSTIEIIPASGSAYANGTVDDEVADFLRGNTITWRELDLHRDVDRDMSRGPSNVVHRLRLLLGASPTDSFAIEHSPGAGGTTVARRIAWELRDEFPSLIVKTYTDDTVDVIEALFQRSNLPLLIVAEAARLPGTKRDFFFNDMKERNIRFVILDVRRRHEPRNTVSTAGLTDPMSKAEALRFLAQYEPKAPLDRRGALSQLVTDDTLASYRSAFFFGLYTFERQFVRVEQFVEDMLSEVAPQARDAIARLALITRYSQERLPVEAFRILLGLDVRRTRFDPANLLGEAAAKLVIFDGTRVCVSHPLLAEEILRRHLSSVHPNGQPWRHNLTAFCNSFIEKMADHRLKDSAVIQEILTDLFIERDIWQQGSNASRLFSVLLNELPAPESQRRILETLCEHFPSNAHFWGHLGRHINLRGTGSFQEAEMSLKRAIELEPNDVVHHHGLGMVYRLEVKRRLREPLSGAEQVRTRLGNVQPVFEQAEACFATARMTNPTNQYPLVTPIQMITETLERFAALSGEDDYPAFLCQTSVVSDWCRAKVATAGSLLAELRHQEANSAPTRYSRECDSRLKGITGNVQGMIEGLSTLLRMPEVSKAPVRRMLANAYVRRIDDGAGTTKPKSLRRIVELMGENISDGLSNGHDIRTWFRAFRMLPEFTVTEAIEQMAHWSLVSDEVDALYYLYILHFISGRRGVDRSVREAKRYITMCKQDAPLLLSKRSFEWLAADSLSRPCPLVHHTELGPWSRERNFFEGVSKLGEIRGRIDEIRSPQAGTIVVDGMPAFFVPRSDFRRVTDLNASVTFFLGFSYEGLRAWNVRRVARTREPHEV